MALQPWRCVGVSVFLSFGLFFWIVCARECAVPTFVGTLWPRSFSWPKRVCPRPGAAIDGQYQSPDPQLQLQLQLRLWLWLWLLLLSTSRMYSFPKGITYVRSGHNKFLHWKCQLGRWFSLFLRNFVTFLPFFWPGESVKNLIGLVGICFCGRHSELICFQCTQKNIEYQVRILKIMNR